MVSISCTKSIYIEGWVKNLFYTLIWKKKFFTFSLTKILKSLFNLTIIKKKLFIFNNIDFRMYLFYVKFKKFKNSISILKLFKLQDESKVSRLIGILLEKYEKNFEKFSIQRVRWKNDLRLNINSKFLFERKSFYLNKIINSSYDLILFNIILKLINKIKKILLMKSFLYKSFFLIKMIGKTNVFLFKNF
jgi:hypothetical protein